ncbi:MAG: hypothetical protein R3F59_16180 [Myxococcota bacterium]
MGTRGTWLGLALLAGCSGDKDPTGTDTVPGTTDTSTSTVDTAVVVVTDLVVADANDYHVTATYSIATGTVRAGWDALVSWPSLSSDAWGEEALAPTAVPTLALLELVMTPSELPARLAADDLGTDLVSTWTADVMGDTFANLSDLRSAQGEAFDPAAYLEANPGKTWLLMLARTRDDGSLAPLDFLALQVDAAGQTSEVFAPGGSTVNWTAVIDGAQVAASAGIPAVTVDWGGLQDDALGTAYDERQGNELFVARFADPASALGVHMLDLQGASDAWYTMDVAGDTDARLELARDPGGAAFPGFDASGTWLVGVRCTTCLTRLPLWTAAVDVL